MALKDGDFLFSVEVLGSILSVLVLFYVFFLFFFALSRCTVYYPSLHDRLSFDTVACTGKDLCSQDSFFLTYSLLVLIYFIYGLSKVYKENGGGHDCETHPSYLVFLSTIQSPFAFKKAGLDNRSTLDAPCP